VMKKIANAKRRKSSNAIRKRGDAVDKKPLNKALTLLSLALKTVKKSLSSLKISALINWC